MRGLRQHALAAVLLAALLLPTLWLLHANWVVAQEVEALETEKTQLTAQAQPVLTARSQALVAMAQLDTLVTAVAHPDALSVLSHVSAQLPGDGNRVRNLELDGRRLRLVLAVPAITPHIAYVRTLEGGGWLQDVREDTQDAAPGTVALSAEIRGDHAPLAAASAAAASSPSSAPTTTSAPIASAAPIAAASAAQGKAVSECRHAGSEPVSKWRDELRGNVRLRAGLAIVVALLWLLGLLEMLDLLDAARKDRSRLNDEVAELRLVGGEQRWPVLRDQAQERLADYRSLAWREESEGRMQAMLQDWLREQLAAVGVQPRDLSVTVLPARSVTPAQRNRKSELPADMRIARARVSFDFKPDTLHQFLAKLPASQRWIWVSRMSVENDSRRLVELELEALFVLGTREQS